jgi:hypothetical protein
MGPGALPLASVPSILKTGFFGIDTNDHHLYSVHISENIRIFILFRMNDLNEMIISIVMIKVK